MTDALARIEKQFAIPVLRQNEVETLVEVSRALGRGGLSVLEITLMNDSAYEAIGILAKEPERFFVGAGTVRNRAQAERVVKAGAKFIVSPGFDDEVAEFCAKSGVTFVPGVFTPSEVQRASNRGFQLLKVFPAGAVGGPAYLKHLSGPFPDLKWIATGGVAMSDIAAYLQVKAFAIGLGSQLFPAGAIEQKNWSEIESAARAVVAEIKRLRP